MNRNIVRGHWFGSRTRLTVTADGDSCLLEIAVRLALERCRRLQGIVIHIEICQQAKDNRGLPQGPVMVIQRVPIHCRGDEDSAWLAGKVWLPSRFAMLPIKDLYFRTESPQIDG
jgi:hypothetical protein